MATILIPANQQAKKGEMINIIINGTIHIGIPCASEHTYTASYDESWNTRDFDRRVHGFGGINDTLEQLVKALH